MHNSSSEKGTNTPQQQQHLAQLNVTSTSKKPRIPTRYAVYVRMNADEHQRLIRDAGLIGKSLPDMLRDGYFHGAPVTPFMPKADAQAIFTALSRIGNNINQIAREVNSGSRATFTSEFTALTEQVVMLNTFLRSVCTGLLPQTSRGNGGHR